MMNANEMKDFVRDTATRAFLNAFPDAVAINEKPYTFAIPVETEKGIRYCRLGLTCMQMEDTKARPGFNPDTDATPAVEAFENMIAMREANKLAKANKPKKSKKKSEEEE